ncbi:hypothetical protein ACP3WZ_27040, partial [Salmonella enterica]|uniref:hypothetical protein n=1 Tax=Salmonella enterica TaxID=28901 RepID=UPI003CE6A6EF
FLLSIDFVKLVINDQSLRMIWFLTGRFIACNDNDHHIYREANKCADKLADHACSLEGGTLMLEQQPFLFV